VWKRCIDRLDHHREEILRTIARNPEASFRDKLSAWNLIAELEAADLRLWNSAPEVVARLTGLPRNSNRLVAKGSTVVNLKLIGGGQQQQQQKEEDEEDDDETEFDNNDDDNNEAYQQLMKDERENGDKIWRQPPYKEQEEKERFR
jgi:hypothetical protein